MGVPNITYFWTKSVPNITYEGVPDITWITLCPHLLAVSWGHFARWVSDFAFGPLFCKT